MKDLLIYSSILMIASTIVAIYLFYRASNYKRAVLFALTAWIGLQGVIALTGFYTITNAVPPRFFLLVIPPMVLISYLFLSNGKNSFLKQLDIKFLTLLHVVRIPVEITLYLLFKAKYVPEIMTFEGHNFDIISGLTAPIIYYLGFVRRTISSAVILIWNFCCFALLVNIVTTAILSAPFPFQKLGFEQPNIALLYFPFIWLPCCIVPLVLTAHVTSVIQILNWNRSKAVTSF